MWSVIDWEQFFPIPCPQLDLELCHASLNGKSVLVTGAAGSVGSAIAQRLLDFQPRSLFLTDQSEAGLFKLGQEITKAKFILGDLTNVAFVRHLLDVTMPEVIVHTAAYKHVLIAEENLPVVVRNNLKSTLLLLQEAHRRQVRVFLNISSDKAVEPVGAMGMTKRLCERLVATYQVCGNRGYFSVRFGNILGSHGSFSNTLVENILRGKLTEIRDREVTRFFTTPYCVVQSLLFALSRRQEVPLLISKLHIEKKIIDLYLELASYMKASVQIPAYRITKIGSAEKLSEKLLALEDSICEEDSFFWFSQTTAYDSLLIANEKILSLVKLAEIFSEELYPELVRETCGIDLRTESTAHDLL